MDVELLHLFASILKEFTHNQCLAILEQYSVLLAGRVVGGVTYRAISQQGASVCFNLSLLFEILLKAYLISTD